MKKHDDYYYKHSLAMVKKGREDDSIRATMEKKREDVSFGENKAAPLVRWEKARLLQVKEKDENTRTHLE